MTVTPEAILDSLRRAKPMCVLCRGTSGHPAIVGDGPPRCYVCLLRLVRLSTTEPVQDEPPPELLP